MRFWGDENIKADEISIDKVLTNINDLLKQQNLHVYLYKVINDEVVLKTMNNLREASMIANAFKIDGINPPVTLHINSLGGIVSSAFALVDYIRGLISKGIEIHTVVEGICASAATLVSTSGSKRFISSNSIMLIHQISLGGWGKYEEFKDLMENAKLMMEKIRRHYKSYTRFTDEDLDLILKRDLYLDAENCLKYGLVDEILK